MGGRNAPEDGVANGATAGSVVPTTGALTVEKEGENAKECPKKTSRRKTASMKYDLS